MDVWQRVLFSNSTLVKRMSHCVSLKTHKQKAILIPSDSVLRERTFSNQDLKHGFVRALENIFPVIRRKNPTKEDQFREVKTEETGSARKCNTACLAEFPSCLEVMLQNTKNQEVTFTDESSGSAGQSRTRRTTWMHERRGSSHFQHIFVSVKNFWNVHCCSAVNSGVVLLAVPQKIDWGGWEILDVLSKYQNQYLGIVYGITTSSSKQSSRASCLSSCLFRSFES